MPTALHAPLTRRLEEAIASILKPLPDLVNVTVKAGIEDGVIEAPYVVVNASRERERIYNSGVYECGVRIHLKTTRGSGPRCTRDEDLLAYDSAIEAVLWGQSPSELAAQITEATDFFQCDAVLALASEPTTFDENRREIVYTFTALCMGLLNTD